MVKTQLGEALKITGKDGDIADFDSNIHQIISQQKIDEKNKEIRIGLLKTPRFDALELGKNDTEKNIANTKLC